MCCEQLCYICLCNMCLVQSRSHALHALRHAVFSDLDLSQFAANLHELLFVHACRSRICRLLAPQGPRRSWLHQHARWQSAWTT